MNELTSSANLATFMLRLDRAAPAGRWSGRFDAMLAAAALEAHFDFISGLNTTARSSALPRQLQRPIAALYREGSRFRRRLLHLPVSGTLSLSSRTVQEPLESMERIYASALEHGHTLMERLIPCSVEWYDATVGRRH